jgi:hypothetical protein
MFATLALPAVAQFCLVDMSRTPDDAEHAIVLAPNASDPSLELRKPQRFADGGSFLSRGDGRGWQR